jgi:hypothetical protein
MLLEQLILRVFACSSSIFCEIPFVAKVVAIGAFNGMLSPKLEMVGGVTNTEYVNGNKDDASGGTGL